MSKLFEKLKLGSTQLNNRIIMAPLTRGRAGAEGVPSDLMAEYYRQRASAGLIIAEATAVSEDGRGWLNSPGLFNDAQQAGWEKVARAVHEKSGAIFVQLWHMGAAVHPDFIDGQQRLSASEVKLSGQLPTPKGRDRVFVTPRAMSPSDIDQQLKNFSSAARRAIDAGLDGVEIHAANGFLIDQFTRDSSNQRRDEYGGSVENRLRFMRRVVEAVCEEIGSDKVGIRLSPTNSQWDIADSEYKETFSAAVKQLNTFNLAYLHLFENKPPVLDYMTPLLREHYRGALIINGGYNQASAEQAITSGLGDAVAFGSAFVANPDLVARYQAGAELAQLNSETLYTPGPVGYVDYANLTDTGR